MIKKQSIWLSDVSKSNDSQELKWFMNEFEAFLRRIWDSLILERKQAGYTDDPDEIQSLYSDIVKALHTESVKCWAFCLSEKRDDLGQWRGYADDGKGFAIGFNMVPFNAPWFEALYNLESDESNGLESLLSPRFGKVEYGEVGLLAFESVFRIGLNLSKEMPPAVIQAKLMSRIIPFKKLAPFYKNKGFQDEAEWRFIYAEECSKLNKNDFKKIAKTEKTALMPAFCPAKWGYTEKNGNLVSHIEFQSRRFEDTISEIVIGPKCKLTETEIKLFFVSCGMFPSMDACDIKISKSESSYQ